MYSTGVTVSNIKDLCGDTWFLDFSWRSLVSFVNIESLCYLPETNIIISCINYT